MALIALRKLNLQTRMPSNPWGLHIWYLIGPFVYFHTLCVRTAKALARLRRCAVSSEPSLFDYAISTISHELDQMIKQWIRTLFFHTWVLNWCFTEHLSCIMTKPTKWHVRPAKTQISLGIRPDWSESSLSAWRRLGSLATHWVHSEDSDQTGQMPRLVWVFAGRTVILLVLSWESSFSWFLLVTRTMNWKNDQFFCLYE